MPQIQLADDEGTCLFFSVEASSCCLLAKNDLTDFQAERLRELSRWTRIRMCILGKALPNEEATLISASSKDTADPRAVLHVLMRRSPSSQFMLVSENITTGVVDAAFWRTVFVSFLVGLDEHGDWDGRDGILLFDDRRPRRPLWPPGLTRSRQSTS